MSFRIPVDVREPLRTSPDTPTEAYELKRVSVPLVYNTTVWLSVPAGYHWVVDAVQINFDTDANVGNRYVDLYVRTRDGNTLYTPAIASAASFVNKYVGQPGMPYSVVSALERLYTGPLLTPVLTHPCRLGARWHTFQGAGDVGTLYAIVREYKDV